MRRWLAVVGLAAVVGLGLTGCGVADRAADQVDEQAAAVDVSAGMGAEGQALAAMGFDPDDITPAELVEVGAPGVAAPKPSPSASAAPKGDKGAKGDGQRGRKLRARVLLRRNTLHGEAVVQAKDGGTQTVVVQRGAVTAVDGDSITVKSTDGFSLTWSFADDLKVVERRSSIEARQLQVGDQVGVAGAKNGDSAAARLIVIPRAK